MRVNNNGATDAMEFYDAANTTPLGLLATGTALTINGRLRHRARRVFNATIARSGSTITVTIGTLISGAVTTKAEGQDAR